MMETTTVAIFSRVNGSLSTTRAKSSVQMPVDAERIIVSLTDVRSSDIK